MLKIVLDANVFASALINPHGKPAEILDCVSENRVRLLASSSIIEELERVLSYPKLVDRHRLPKREIEEFIYGLLSIIALVEEGDTIAVIKEAPSDNKYLSCALKGRADFIVSGDEHLLNLGSYKGIQITIPAQFLEMIEEEGEKIV